MSIETDFEAWYAEQGRIWAANPRRKQYPLTAEGVQEGLKDASRLAYQAATERAAKLLESGAPPRKLEGGRVEIGEGARNAYAAAIRGYGRPFA